jgi:phosphatidylserine/phosphatidylglycerophosphate/cardiolipin synthase-like enzyme
MKLILEHEQIHNAIARKIGGAQHSIKICVAWFTCTSLATALKERLSKTKISIIISNHEFNLSANHFKSLVKFPNCTLHILPTIEQKMMHNKFCIIDDNIVITGSYNWSDRAENNYENILICEDPDLARQYTAYFNKLQTLSDHVPDFSKYVKGFVTNSTLESDEKETFALAKEFEDQVYANLEKSKKYIRINFARLANTINIHSGVGAARIFVNDPKIQSGLEQLKTSKEFQLSFEWMVLQPKYATLFNTNTKNMARKKLKECGYEFAED